MFGCRISATIVDLITSKRDILTEFRLTTERRISATTVDLITSKRNLTEFRLMTGRRISATIVVLITPKKDTLMEIYDHDWTQNL